MRPVYSTRFVLETLTTPGYATPYVVPDGRTAIISCITLQNVDAGDTQAGAVVDPGTGQVALFGALLAPLEYRIERELHVVLEEGDTMILYVASGGASLSMCGYLLTNL